MQRLGWRETGLYSFLGFYPWRCAVCRTKIYLRKRARNDKKRGAQVD